MSVSQEQPRRYHEAAGIRATSRFCVTPHHTCNLHAHDKTVNSKLLYGLMLLVVSFVLSLGLWVKHSIRLSVLIPPLILLLVACVYQVQCCMFQVYA